MKTAKLGWIVIVTGLIIAIVFIFSGNFIDKNGSFDPDKLSKYGGFIGGTVGVLFSLAGYILIYETLKSSKFKQFEDSFYTRFSLFHEFRAKQISLIYKEEIKSGVEFFDTLFKKQMAIKSGEKKNKIFFKNHLEIHSSQFSYYFGLFEMCLSSIYENNLNNKMKNKYVNFLDSMLTEQEKFILSIFDIIMEKDLYPLTDKFKTRYSEIKQKTVID